MRELHGKAYLAIACAYVNDGGRVLTKLIDPQSKLLSVPNDKSRPIKHTHFG